LVRKGGPLLVIVPHPDDLAIALGALVYDLGQLCVHVVALLMYTGHRVVGAASRLSKEEREQLREEEARQEARWLRYELDPLRLPSYDVPGYEPSPEEFDKVVKKISEFSEHPPGAVLCPPAKDGHAAHRAVRALLAVGLLENQFDVPVFNYTTPWGKLSKVTHYHPYSYETSIIKDRAIRAHVSQYEDHYAEYVHHHDRALLPLLPQLTGGFYRHHNGNGRHGAQPAGVELFYRLDYDPKGPLPEDPILLVQGILRGYLEEDVLTAGPLVEKPDGKKSPTRAPHGIHQNADRTG
jgi:LmbE family N-acetylglucosaminyl deacetylase